MTAKAATLYVRCQDCEGEHVAEYSHESQYGQGAIYAVVCTATDEWLTDYYTTELLYTKPSNATR